MEQLEFVKVLYALAGRRGAKAVFWFFVVVGGVGLLAGMLAGLNPAVESIDHLSERLRGERFAFGEVLSAVFVLVFTLLLLVIFGAGLILVAVTLGYIFRIGLWIPFHRRLGQRIKELVTLLDNVAQEQQTVGVYQNSYSQLLAKVQSLQHDWETAWTVRLVHWLATIRKKRTHHE